MSGYQALRQHAAWLDLSGRGKLRASGPDRARLLHALCTSHVQKLHPGDGCYTFFLNAQGRILADASVLCFEDHFLLDTEPETRAGLLQHLEHYVIADDVTFSDETGRWVTLSVEGPDSDIVLERMDIPTPAEPYSTAPWGDSIVARLDTTGAGGYFLIAPAARKKELATRFSKESVPQATAEEARVVRIERGRPRYGEEITERYLVQETGQMHAVSFDKGCYLGQEIVERVRSRAQIHRVLRRVEIESRTPPAPGDQLRSGDADAGEIASAAFSQGLGKTVALAYVRVAFAEPGTQLMLSQSAARVL